VEKEAASSALPSSHPIDRLLRSLMSHPIAVDFGKTDSVAAEKLNQRNRRVASYRELVRPIALHYSALSPECADDLIQVGLLGLIRAAELFLPSLGTPFSAFARQHIRGAILHYLRDQAAPIRLPRRQQELEDRLRQLKRTWPMQAGREPNATEICAALGLGLTQWQRFEQLRGLARPVSLDLHGIELAAPDQPASAGSGAEEGRAMAVLEGLDPGLQAVVRRVVLEGCSLRQAAKAMNVSPMTVHRRLRTALVELRSRLKESSQDLSSELRVHPGASVAPAC